MSERILTIPEVAEALRVTKGRAYELVREGHLSCIRIGKQVRVRETALEDFIERGGFELPGEERSDLQDRAAS